MKKYLYALKGSFQIFFEYRLNFVWIILSIILSTSILVIFWINIITVSTSFPDLGKDYVIKYYIGVGLINSLNLFNIWRFAREIRDGEIVHKILKPISYIIYWFIEYIPTKLIAFALYLTTGFVLLINNIVLFPQKHFILPFIISLTIGIIGSFLLYFCIGLLAIWFKRVHGFYYFTVILNSFFAGMYIPLHILPELFQKISRFTPFRYFTYLPIEISQGTITGNELTRNFIIEIAWLLVLYTIYKFLWKKGLKNLDVVGI
ncbi:ABC transporter permease [Patescibacteria group bacterium]